MLETSKAPIPRPVASALSNELLGIFLPIPRNGSYANIPIEDLSAADWKLLAADQPEAGWRWAERITRLAAGQLQQILLAEADLRQVRELLSDQQGSVTPAVAVADAAGEIEAEIAAEADRTPR